MTARLAQIWRHPVKAHGREQIETVTLEPGKALPWDRLWAVAHTRSKFDPAQPEWQPPINFSRGCNLPRLQQITCTCDTAAGRITFNHPDCPAITINPNDPDDTRRFMQWITPFSGDTELLPAQMVRAPDTAMTDTVYASISCINLATHRAVEAQIGRPLDQLRWRGNLLIEGLEPWEEMNWPGKRLTLGEVEFDVIETIGRCRMTEANPETGARDVEMLRLLRDGFGHTDCGVYLKVVKGGTLRQDMPIGAVA
ncbi:MOSC domain-containing protein [Aquicoccus sp. G2-2]|uniref:MOSC domain-containing protein n=1 Tax=Aquicoccus sp. G2-2 TaxID=3092120 RepID=UPI002AE09145|nr:MOSC N-terminal beta barrel domain-containing protein [Aquicoccus sp. G2-2]MEA1113820.1 MOSC domain-containing protein [Aquicoccus sp. G2-2]